MSPTHNNVATKLMREGKKSEGGAFKAHPPGLYRVNHSKAHNFVNRLVFEHPCAKEVLDPRTAFEIYNMM